MKCAGKDCKRVGTRWFVFENVCARVCVGCGYKLAMEQRRWQQENDDEA